MEKQILVYPTQKTVNVVIDGEHYTKEDTPIEMLRLSSEFLKHALESLYKREKTSQLELKYEE